MADYRIDPEGLRPGYPLEKLGQSGATDGQVPVWNATTGQWEPGTPSTSGALTVQDENSNVSTAVTQIDFQGAGVTATAGSGEVIVTIPTPTFTETLPVSIVDAKGDLIAGTADNTAARVAAGSDGNTLISYAAAAAGVKWLGSSVPSILLPAGSGAGAVPAGTPVGTLVLVKA